MLESTTLSGIRRGVQVDSPFKVILHYQHPFFTHGRGSASADISDMSQIESSTHGYFYIERHYYNQELIAVHLR